ncbi:unnamed protein product, partial [Pylaiella littoralis]
GACCRAREGSRKPGSEGAACETLGNTIFALTANLPSLNLGLEAPLVQCSGSSSRPLRHAAAGRGLIAASWQRLTQGGVGGDAGGAVNEECATHIQPPHPSSLLTTHAHTHTCGGIYLWCMCAGMGAGSWQGKVQGGCGERCRK